MSLYRILELDDTSEVTLFVDNAKTHATTRRLTDMSMSGNSRRSRWNEGFENKATDSQPRSPRSDAERTLQEDVYPAGRSFSRPNKSRLYRLELEKNLVEAIPPPLTPPASNRWNEGEPPESERSSPPCVPPQRRCSMPPKGVDLFKKTEPPL